MNSLLQEWQHRLGLDDWFIDLRTDVSPNDMILKEVEGETEWNEVNKCAVINILNPKDYGTRIIPFDREKTLVHELLHVKFAFLQNNENELQNRLVHQMIEDMAKALIDSKRSRRKNNG